MSKDKLTVLTVVDRVPSSASPLLRPTEATDCASRHPHGESPIKVVNGYPIIDPSQCHTSCRPRPTVK